MDQSTTADEAAFEVLDPAFDADAGIDVPSDPHFEDKIICWYEGDRIPMSESEWNAVVAARQRFGHVLSRDEVLDVLSRVVADEK